MLVTREISDVLDTNEPYFPRATVEALIARFCTGQFVTVSREKEPEADLKRLVDVDEVWSMSFRTPRPGGRLLGRFLERDVFVGLGLYLREELGGSTYSARAADTIAEWIRMLGNIEPVRSAELANYLSHTYRDLDADD